MTEKKNEVRVRRVGTATLGIALILIGSIWLLDLLLPRFELMQAARFSPVILILLGLEFLSVGFAKEDRPVRYDIFSVFMCLFLVGTVLGLTALAVILQHC